MGKVVYIGDSNTTVGPITTVAWPDLVGEEPVVNEAIAGGTSTYFNDAAVINAIDWTDAYMVVYLLGTVDSAFAVTKAAFKANMITIQFRANARCVAINGNQLKRHVWLTPPKVRDNPTRQFWIGQYSIAMDEIQAETYPAARRFDLRTVMPEDLASGFIGDDGIHVTALGAAKIAEIVGPLLGDVTQLEARLPPHPLEGRARHVLLEKKARHPLVDGRAVEGLYE